MPRRLAERWRAQRRRKAIAIIFPISAFGALGFEHCIANLYLLPVGMLAGAKVSLLDLVGNILPVTLGNILGGVGVGVAYWLVHLSNDRRPRLESREGRSGGDSQ